MERCVKIGDFVANTRRDEPSAVRYCACGTRLSRYNDATKCGACEVAARPAVIRAAVNARRCERCGWDISHRHPQARFCSQACGSAMRKRRKRAGNGQVVPVSRRCKRCGEEFRPNNHARVYCGDGCVAAARKERRQGLEKRRDYHRVSSMTPERLERRRAQKREYMRRKKAEVVRAAA